MKSSRFQFNRVVLPNNLRVLTYPIPTVQSIYVRVDIRNGSAFENEKESGISHFIEHWIHQGNTKYPSSSQFATLIEQEGIFQNGITYPFGSYYYMKSPSLKLEKTIDLMHLLISQPTFPQNRIEHVREIIINEYNDYWQRPESKFYDTLTKKRYKDYPPYLRDALGTPETITTITRSDVEKWYERFHHAGNMILTVAGNFEQKDLEKVLSKTFSKLAKSDLVKFPPMSQNNYSDALIHHQPENRDQITFSITIPAFGWRQYSTRTSFVLSLLTSVLGGGRFSRLFELLREKNNLVYDISCGKSLDPSRGVISLHGYTSKQNLTKTLLLIKKELTNVMKNGVKDKEVTIAKNIFESYNAFRMETPEGIAQHLINQEFWGEKIWTPEKVVKEISSITKSEVNKLAEKYLTFEKVNVGLFGNLSKKEIGEINNIFTKTKGSSIPLR